MESILTNQYTPAADVVSHGEESESCRESCLFVCVLGCVEVKVILLYVESHAGSDWSPTEAETEPRTVK